MKTYYKIHLQGGIGRTTRRGIRQLDLDFYGVGCPHLAIECLIAQLNKLLMHFGSQSCLGLEMQSSVELLMIELSLSIQLFREDFSIHHHWVTHSVWEKSSRLKIDVTLADLPSQPLRERDLCVMQEFGRLNYSSDDLQCLNRVRMHQQVLFLSDVMDVSGRAIDRKYLQPRPMDETWSDLVFPIEFTAPRDFRIRKEAITQIWALRVGFTWEDTFNRDTRSGSGDTI